MIPARIPVVLFGVGRMGRNHLRVLSESTQFRVQAAVDKNPDASVRESYPDLPLFSTLDELSASGISYDAAVVATSTETHFDVASQLIRLGKHLLVEKPLASTFEQCNELIQLSREKDQVLAVGHIERFNPAVRKLREVLKSGACGEPIHIAVTRVGGYPQHVNPGNNVLLDLAVHDLDVLRSLIGPLRVIGSYCHKTIQQDVFDTGTILLTSASGVSASIHANWITPTKIRTIRVTGSRGVCFVDYILQTCELLGGNLLNTSLDHMHNYSAFVQQYQNSDRIVFGIKKEEPLKIEMTTFAAALRGDRSEICSAQDGASAVRLADQALLPHEPPPGEIHYY